MVLIFLGEWYGLEGLVVCLSCVGLLYGLSLSVLVLWTRFYTWFFWVTGVILCVGLGAGELIPLYASPIPTKKIKNLCLWSDSMVGNCRGPNSLVVPFILELVMASGKPVVNFSITPVRGSADSALLVEKCF